MGRIFFGQRSYDFAQVKKSMEEKIDPTFSSALQFCHQWLNGQSSFQLFTSGSTGEPKPIELTRAQMETSAQSTCTALQLGQGNTALVCLNTSYIAGIMMLVRGMVADMDLWLTAPVSSPLQEIDPSVPIDFAAFVPLQLQTMLQENDPDVIRRLQNMKAIIVGGAPVSIELAEKINSLSSPVYLTYGMTETVSHIALRRLNGKEKTEDYHILPGVSIDVDERNCLKIRAAVTNNQWIQTNDIVTLTSPSSFLWLGRADYTINSGGVKIQPEKIEQILSKQFVTHGISVFFVAGLPHPILGEALTLFVETEEPIADALVKEMSSVLERFHIPKAVILLRAFPRTATGKIERSKIKEAYKNYYAS
ncbi:MAG TPA: AMP-binding protein [Cytophagaceae bacterium]|nr:AMP-binding protein [Cytophagaceae bacterium]